MNPANALSQLSPGMAECHARLMAVAKHGTTEAFSATLAGVLHRAELSISNAYDAGAKSIQIEAIGACGVSGPLVGQPQAMPDLSQLTERGAKAWAGVDAQALREGRRDAEKEAKDADMATAEARGFRDGAASAMAGEPVAWMTFTEEGDPDMVFRDRLEACQYCEDDDPPKPLYLAAPRTAQAEGWRPIETAPRDGTPIWLYTGAGQCEGYWNYGEWVQDAVSCTYDGAGGPAFQCNPTHWMPLPLPPTSAEGVEHG